MLRRLLLLSAAGLVALPAFLASAALPNASSVSSAATYLRAQQLTDGGFGGFGPGQTFDATLGLRSAGIDPNLVKKDGKSPADFLVANAATQTTPAAAGKAALAAKALGLAPTSVAGVNLIAVVTGGLNAATGRYADDDFSQALSMLGLACTSNTVPAGAVAALKAAQVADGGWGFGGTSDPDTTALAVQALRASGVATSDTAVANALAFLKSTQAADGGWGFDPTASNANSTAFVVQALLALGENPESATYTKGANTPITFLLSQQGDDGSFAGFDPVFATTQTLPAVAGRTYCNMAETPLASSPAPTPTATKTGTVTATSTAPTATSTPTAPPTKTPTATPTTVPPTATATAPRPTATATRTVVSPLPPKTGTSSDSGDGGTSVFVVAGLGALVLGATGFGLTKRRQR